MLQFNNSVNTSEHYQYGSRYNHYRSLIILPKDYKKNNQLFQKNQFHYHSTAGEIHDDGPTMIKAYFWHFWSIEESRDFWY